MARGGRVAKGMDDIINKKKASGDGAASAHNGASKVAWA